MADSHYRSNIIAKAGTEKISGFSYIASITTIKNVTDIESVTNIQADTLASAPTVKASSYIQIGGKYIFTTSYSHAASINPEATTLIGKAVPVGSIALSGNGELWIWSAANTATMIPLA